MSLASEYRKKKEEEKKLSSIPTEETTAPSDAQISSDTTEPTATEKEEPKTTLKGIGGAIVRGAVPPLAYEIGGLGAGYLAGGAPGAGVGAVTAPILAGLADIGSVAVKYYHPESPLAKSPTERIQEKIPEEYFPKPKTAAERYTELGASLLAGSPATFASKSAARALEKGGAKAIGGVIAKYVPEIAEKVAPKAQKVAEFLGEKPLRQLGMGALAGGTVQTAQELGVPPALAFAAGLLSPAAYGATKAVGTAALKGLAPVAESLVPSLKETKLFQGYKDVEAQQRFASIVQKNLPKDPEERAKVLDAIKKGQQFSEEGVKLTPGQLSGYDPLLAMEKVAEKTIPEVAQRKAENLRAISNKIDEALQPVGAGTPKDTESYFKSVFDSINNETNTKIAEAKQAGHLESAQVLEDAALKAEEIRTNAEKGVLTKEEALKQVKDTYKELFEKTKATTEVTAKDAFSKNVYDSIVAQKNLEKTHLAKLGSEASVEVPPFYQESAISSREKLIELARGKERRIPQKIQTIIDEAIQAKESGKTSTVNDVIGDIQEINKELRAANSIPARSSEIPFLEQFKDALNQDLLNQEGASEKLKIFNRAYRDYAQIYKEGASKEVFKPGSFASKTLDEYIGKSEASASKEDIERLRKAILGTGNVVETGARAGAKAVTEEPPAFGIADLPQQPYLMDKERLPVSTQVSPEGEISFAQKPQPSTKETGIKNVTAWILGRMSSNISETNSSKSINNWMTTQGNRVLEVFPEARPLVEDVRSQFKTIEDQANAAKQAVKNAKNEKIAAGSDARIVNTQAKAKSVEIEKQYQEQVKKLQQDLNDKIESEFNPANEFFGANVPELIGNIMGKGAYAETNFGKLIDQAKKDPTGKAYEGLVNGFKFYLNKSARSETQTMRDLGIPEKQISISKLKADIGNMTKLLQEGSVSRNVAEMLLGKDSPELAKIDRARQMMEMITTETPLQGTSLEKLIGKTGDQLSNDLFSIAGIAVGGFKGFVVFKTVDLLRKLQARTRIDIGERMQKMLSDALLDTKQFEKLTTPITQESFPVIQDLLQQYGITTRATDFGLSEKKQQKEEKEESTSKNQFRAE